MSSNQYEDQREHEVHMANLQGMPEEEAGPRALEFLSESDELDVEKALEWTNTETATTTNLTREDVLSTNWRIEYFNLFARMQNPPHYGLTGHRRAWAYGHRAYHREPYTPEKAMEIEGQTEHSKQRTQKSAEGWTVEEALRQSRESIMRKEEEEAAGGLRDRIFG